MKKLFLPLVCLLAIFVTGCASTRQFVAIPDQTKPVADQKGRIYVIRPAVVGSAISMNVADDGKPIGSTGPRGYLCWERSPGATIISSQSEGVSKAPITVEAGKVYYIFQHIRMGVLIARNELEIVEEAEGKKILKKCKAPRVELKSFTPAQGSPKNPGST